MKKFIVQVLLLSLMIAGCGISENVDSNPPVENKDKDKEQPPSTDKTESKNLENPFVAASASVGDVVAGMTIKELEVAKDASSIIALFEGSATVSGRYIHHSDNEFLGHEVCFFVDEVSDRVLPRATIDEREMWFCWTNHDDAEKAFGPPGSEGTATVVVDEFKIDYRPTEVWNTAKLIEVISIDSTESEAEKEPAEPSSDAFESFKVQIDHEGKDDDTLMDVIRQLESIVENKDKDGLLELVDEHIKYSFGDPYEPGRKGFVTYWKLDDNPDKSRVWSELHEILSLGGAYDAAAANSKAFYRLPNLSINHPEGDVFSHYAVVGDDVNVREKPDVKSATVDKVSWEFVMRNGNPTEEKIEIDGQSYDWLPIITPKGEHGYIVSKYVRSPLDYRVVLSNADGEWKMITLIAGD